MKHLRLTPVAVLAVVWAACAATLSACGPAPVYCRSNCDGGGLDVSIPIPDGGTETGGTDGSGGNAGSGGVIGSGGSPVVSTGGNGGTATGGGGTGGRGTGGGSGGSGTGGNATGGSGTGGRGTGGSATGGSGTGGRGTGGSATGGSATGGSATGGSGTGGGSTGGSASGGSGTGGSATGGSGPDPDLVLWYKFDESSGTTARDSAMSGGVTTRNATLSTIGTGGSATFSTMKQVGTNSLNLTPSTTSPNANGGYVVAPALQTLAPAAITIAVWVNLAANTTTQNWQRVYDFGPTAAVPNMYLTTRAADVTNTPVRFAISTTAHTLPEEQRIEGTTTLTPNVWHHIAVVLPAGSPYTGTLYIDGVSVGTNSAMTFHVSDLGATTNNWIGRSHYSDTTGSNPCFNGLIDDFRVYKRALTAAEIAALFGP
jgi:hypothetical protein